MISRDITHGSGDGIELFTFHSDGDPRYGDVIIDLESPRVELVDETMAFPRHGNQIAQVTIPFEVLAEFVGGIAQSLKISEIEDQKGTVYLGFYRGGA